MFVHSRTLWILLLAACVQRPSTVSVVPEAAPAERETVAAAPGSGSGFGSAANDPQSLSIGAGAFFSDIVDDQDRTVFSLPPRYRDHEEALVRVYSMAGVHAIGLRKAWGQLRDMLGDRAIKRAPLAA